MEWGQPPFIRFAFFFASGIVIGKFISPSFPTTILLTLITFIIFCISWRLQKAVKTLTWNKSLRNLSIYLFLVTSGLAFYSGVLPENHANHYSRFTFKQYKVIIVSEQEETDKNIKVVGAGEAIYENNSWKYCSGKVMLYLPKSSEASYGTVLWVKGMPSRARKALNPHQFDYSEHLYGKGITHIHFLKTEQFKSCSSKVPSYLKYFAIICATVLERRIAEYIPDKENQALISALLFGRKTDLNESVTEAFSDSGIIHLLAVSGFHVALLYQLLQAVLFVFRIQKNQIVFTIVTLLILWFYAVITGLSPSVLRATLMFTVYLLSKAVNRECSPLHSLFLTAFILLLLNPFYLFDIGFQLSFTAVLGILMFFPSLNRMFKSKNFIIQKVLDLMTIAISCQIFTFPLVIYYFHKFPTYFLLSNLVVFIPAVLLVYLSLVLIPVSFIPILASYLADGINLLASILKGIAGYISGFPNGLKDLYPSNFQLALVFLAVFFSIALISFRKPKFIVPVGVFLLIFIVSNAIHHYDRMKRRSFVVFDCKDKIVAGFINGKNCILFSENKISEASYSYYLKNSIKALGIEKVDFMTVKNETKVKFAGKEFYIGNNKPEAENTSYWIVTKPKEIVKVAGLSGNIKIICNSSEAEVGKSFNFPVYNIWKQGAYFATIKN